MVDQEKLKTTSDNDKTDDYYEPDLDKKELPVANEPLPEQEPLDENMEVDAIALLVQGFKKKETPTLLPRLRRKQPILVPRKTKFNEKEILYEPLLATIAIL
jgi:hypothetical protein